MVLSGISRKAYREKSGGLWHGHAATPRQAAIAFPATPSRKTQADVLIGMLRDARTRGRALTLPEIMAVGIAQHGARFTEIRERGFIVENETERIPGGSVASRYWLRHDPDQDGGQQ